MENSTTCKARQRFRILTWERKVKFAGTDTSSWFFSLQDAKAMADHKAGDRVYEFSWCGEPMWECF